MQHEILLEATCSPEEFLSILYQQYPYDIEKQMVLTLLDKDTYPHPALLKFIAYFATFPKYRISMNALDNSLDHLCARMSQLFQNNKNTLHTYVFHFDATLQITPYKMKYPYAHLCFTKIPFITIIQLHTLPLLSMEATFIECPITRCHSFLFKDISIDANEFYAVSIQISDKHGIVYVPRNQIGVAIAISIIYEVVPPSTEIDFLLLYGLHSHEKCLSYYFDETNQIYIGLIAGERFYHFIYVMHMLTSLYNAICIEKHDLPVHACMLQIGKQKLQRGILLIGDDHSGKSELCDSLITYCEQHQMQCTCVFENCGTLHYLDNEISATGMQIGACVSIHGLTKERLFQKFPLCAFLRSKQEVTHILFPFTTCKETTKFHNVHTLFYLNNHDKKQGCHKIALLDEAKQLFIQKNIHPLKPNITAYSQPCAASELEVEQILKLVDQYFNIMMINDLYIGEINTQNKRYRKGKCIQDILQKIE